MSRSTSRQSDSRYPLLSRRGFLYAGAAGVGAALLQASPGGAQQSGAQQSGAQPGSAQPGAGRISTTDLKGTFLLQGAGCNVLALPGVSGDAGGALMIDGGLAANADALLAAVKNVTSNSRIHTLINTHWHPEQTGANEAVGRAGGVIFAHEKTKLYLSSAVYSETFKGRRAALPDVARPTRTIRGDGAMEFAGQPVNYGYMPAAHSDSDIYLHLPKMNLLVVGGVVSAEEWPLLDHRNGAWFGGRVRAVERLAEIVAPDTRVVPANGRMMTGAEIVRHRDMYQKLFVTLIDYMNKGYGPEDAVERNPVKEFQAEFGDPSAFLYGAMRSMMIAYVPD
jgi:glyoxylase-like metal-dependent hydrolase (beta-lactamase superfamily II)